MGGDFYKNGNWETGTDTETNGDSDNGTPAANATGRQKAKHAGQQEGPTRERKSRPQGWPEAAEARKGGAGRSGPLIRANTGWAFEGGWPPHLRPALQGGYPVFNAFLKHRLRPVVR